MFPPFSFLYCAVSPTIGSTGVNSVYPLLSGVILVNVKVYSYSSFGMISCGPLNTLPISVDGCPLTKMVISSVVKLNILSALSKNLSFTRNFTIPFSASISPNVHIGSTTSTISSSPSCPPGSSFPILIDFAELMFPDLSVTVPCANDKVIYPLYVYPSPLPSASSWSSPVITN